MSNNTIKKLKELAQVYDLASEFDYVPNPQSGLNKAAEYLGVEPSEIRGLLTEHQDSCSSYIVELIIQEIQRAKL
jgi:hypothetical protein